MRRPALLGSLTLLPSTLDLRPGFGVHRVPCGRGTITVMAAGDENGPAVWGFITVTNNETQHITTITP